MNQCPATTEDLQEMIAQASRDRKPAEATDLRHLNRILMHIPEDLTCTVQCGMTLEFLQTSLAAHGQWLPLDPPDPEHVTVRDVIDQNLNGPRRLGFGTVRDYLIGLEVVCADGTRIRSGGQVVKNVAGYDLHKLFIGARGMLGIPVTATFKLLPIPEASIEAQSSVPDAARAAALALRIRQACPDTTVIDILHTAPDQPYTLWVEYSGTTADVVSRNQTFENLGLLTTRCGEWSRSLSLNPALPPHRLSVLPSRLPEALLQLHGFSLVARAGNGIVYHDGPAPGPVLHQAPDLLRRIREAFDPHGILSMNRR